MFEHTLLSRRTVLHGLGTALALPLLEAMLPRSARAFGPQADKAPVRMGFFYVANGKHMPDWIPTTTGRDFELPPTLAPLADHKQSLTVLSGLALDGGRAKGDGPGDHARSVASFLTGAHPRKTSGANIENGVSVDQVAAEHIGSQTKLPSLELGTEPSQKSGSCDSGYSCIYSSNLSWRTPTSPLAKEINPAAAFDRLFGNSQPDEQGKVQLLREQNRRSVLDFVQEDATALKNQLGAGDRRKLDEYLFAVRDIERRLTMEDRLRGQETGVDFPRPAGAPRDFGEHVKLMMDMIVLAFQTDTTRVASLMYTNDSSNRSYPHLGVRDGHHNLSHHGRDKEKQAKISKINHYHIELFSYVVGRMAAIQEPGGTLLDNSMLVYGSGIGDGDRHNHDNLPVLLVGRGGGTIDSGRHIRYYRETPMCNLYLSMLHRMGAQVESFSDSTGPLKELAG